MLGKSIVSACLLYAKIDIGATSVQAGSNSSSLSRQRMAAVTLG